MLLDYFFNSKIILGQVGGISYLLFGLVLYNNLNTISII